MRTDGEISLEQLRKLLHISKRKAAWMLQNGIIPCRIRDTSTHKYAIRSEDVDAYLTRSAVTRQMEIPIGMFSSKPRKSSLPSAIGRELVPETVLSLRGKKRARFKEMLEDALADVPDSLTIDEVAKVIGYSRSMVLYHVQEGHIYAVRVSGRYVVAKSGIVDFLTTDRAFRIHIKSEWHTGVIVKYDKGNVE